jgi:hypothetical protein
VPGAVGAVADGGIARLLASRTTIAFEEYERIVRAGDVGGEPPPSFAGDFVFHGVRSDRREYGRVAAEAAA